MKKKELPIHYPLVSNYPQHAFYFSIISNNKDCLPWIYSNYLNMCLIDSEDECFLDYFAQTPEHHYHPCFVDSQRLLRATMLKFTPNIVEFLKEQILLENYIWLHVNEYYIPGSPAYQKYSFPHAIFIYGFNDNEQRFNISGFFENRKYMCSYASYSEIENSFYDFGKSHIDSDVTQHINYMHLLRLPPNHHQGLPYQLDMRFVAEQIKDYYESKNLTLNFRYFLSHESYSDWTYGMNILLRLKRRFELQLEDNRGIDRKTLYTLYDYRKLMTARFKYITENNFYDVKPMFCEGFKTLENKSENLLNVHLKYGLTQDKKYIHKLINLLDEIYLSEKVLLERLLNDFSDQSLV
ncbi:hypothetical protein [Paenibacillus sp.]|uniref:hypothetical protein n=1 Tax=Paenibacillus sp. TaxID=58172 RepID=UPI0028AB2A84|nr:hypothetical protein [Paenibacillus sp.]